MDVRHDSKPGLGRKRSILGGVKNAVRPPDGKGILSSNQRQWRRGHLHSALMIRWWRKMPANISNCARYNPMGYVYICQIWAHIPKLNRYLKP